MLDWVQEKIQRARAEGWTRLDLGNAGLTEVPDEVCTLNELKVLVLGRSYYDLQLHRWVNTENKGPKNTITTIPAQIARLTHLRALSLDRNQVSNLEPLAALTNLTWLDLAVNRLSNLEPLAALTNLTWLNLSGNCNNQLF